MIGGAVCIIGQIIKDTLLTLCETMTLQEATTWELISLIFLASFLTSMYWRF